MLYGKYDALDVAEYVLSYCENELHRPISNLRLQKVLYYIQGVYLSNNHEPLFDNEIQAWDYGPVIPDVYYTYNGFIGNSITGVIPQQVDLLQDDEIQIIQQVVNEKINGSVWDLVRQTHEESPWLNNFRRGYNNEIPIADMEDWFINN
ncbi:MAG: Panacea domain-containing protein [Paraclostridium sp.]